jgi:hypothetical protein
LCRVEKHRGKTWTGLPLTWLQERGQNASYDADDLASGLLILICGDVIRPGLPWMLTRTHARLAGAMAHTRDPQGFAQLQRLAETQPASSATDARVAATRIATILACKGGRVADITVGDSVELVEPCARYTLEADKRRSTSTYVCARSTSSPTMRRTRSAPSGKPPGGSRSKN